VRQLQNVAETSIVAPLAGQPDPGEFDALMQRFNEVVGPVEVFFREADAGLPGWPGFEAARGHFTVRPTFSARLPTAALEPGANAEIEAITETAAEP
jgi:hypothetical protein